LRNPVGASLKFRTGDFRLKPLLTLAERQTALFAAAHLCLHRPPVLKVQVPFKNNIPSTGLDMLGIVQTHDFCGELPLSAHPNPDDTCIVTHKCLMSRGQKSIYCVLLLRFGISSRFNNKTQYIDIRELQTTTYCGMVYMETLYIVVLEVTERGGYGNFQ
jgi:hypothetical protein